MRVRESQQAEWGMTKKIRKQPSQTMLKMKWMTDHDGRISSGTWTESGELDRHGQRAETIMLKIVEARSPKGNPGSNASRWVRLYVLMLMLVSVQFSLFASTGGSITGVVKDPTGAVIPGATVTAINSVVGVKQTTRTDGQGLYSFPVLAVGTYEIEVSENGFQPYRVTGLRVDINSALVADVTLQLGEQTQAITVMEQSARVETADTQLGQVIGSKQVTEVPLNGRSYTDLLATQVGVTPLTTSGAQNSSSGGGFGTVPVAGNGNTGQFSINGQREDPNGFYLNGASVQESIGQQAGILPNLDSISQFRI